MPKYKPFYLDENEERQEYKLFSDVFEFENDFFDFIELFMPAEFDAWETTGFIEWIYEQLDLEFNTSFIAYETDTSFLRHLAATCREWLPWAYKGFQLYTDKFDPNLDVDQLFKAWKEKTTVNRTGQLSKTGTDTLSRTGTELSVETTSDQFDGESTSTLVKTGTEAKVQDEDQSIDTTTNENIKREGDETTFTKGATTPTHLDSATDFVGAYTNQQTENKLTLDTEDTRENTIGQTLERDAAETITRNLTDTNESNTTEGRSINHQRSNDRNLIDAQTKNLLDEHEEDTEEARERDASVFEILELFNKIQPTILGVLMENFSKHFINLYFV
jgi:hypothetical protein